ncbi:MxaK protein [Peristeroidobacter agariperforans]|uniref:MxaK protein n=1 Tax=Peristeroidobacter agariperforans TaxID=268404 RepID=UPI00101CB5F1|nr:MxaK protein [Peristeroidobacter agariperforans]
MKRSIVHGAFAAVALACGSLAAHHALRLDRIKRTNAAITSARVSDFEASVPEARFARALAFARAGESEAAVKAYKALIEGDRRDLGRAAAYNLGNLYMRDALANGASEAFRSLPLIELAKQRYRDVLRNEPAHWDARYNLSRALQLAPELEQQIEEKEEPPEREQSTSTLQGVRIDLP